MTSAVKNGGDPIGRAEPTPKARSVWETSQLLTADQVAKLLQVPKSWVYEQSRVWASSDGTRGLPTVTLGRYRRYRAQAIKAHVEQLERPQARNERSRT